MQCHEWQFDGLVGPTHNYAGLAAGNVASQANKGAVSNPRQAALQGLEKAKFVRDLGFRQAIIPPHYRPMIPYLQQLGFGTGMNALAVAASQAPHLLTAIYSSSFMWVANTGMITPSSDSADGRLHLTPANLLTNFHRAIEAEFTNRLWRRLLNNVERFAVHGPLPAASPFSDEGAANHMRVTATGHGNSGLHIYVHGDAADPAMRPKRFPARQTRAACEAIARQHGVRDGCQFFVQQSPEAIDAGVFHNDVIAMNTTRLMITHEKAFVEGPSFLLQLGEAAKPLDWLHIGISESELPLADAVKSYLFNSQLLETPDGQFIIIAPSDCAQVPTAHRTLSGLTGGNGPISAVHYLDVRDSMRNGGGPACLRLRVVLTEDEAQSMHQGVVLTDALYDALVAWIKGYYRDRLQFDDLKDPAFVQELHEAYSALEGILDLPGLYQLA